MKDQNTENHMMKPTLKNRLQYFYYTLESERVFKNWGDILILSCIAPFSFIGGVILTLLHSPNRAADLADMFKGLGEFIRFNYEYAKETGRLIQKGLLVPEYRYEQPTATAQETDENKNVIPESKQVETNSNNISSKKTDDVSDALAFKDKKTSVTHSDLSSSNLFHHRNANNKEASESQLASPKIRLGKAS